MKCTFLGTRGYIDARSRRHRMHSSMLISYRGQSVMVDAGEDWLERLDEVGAHAIIITHAHPDHAGGLKQGAPCPVYATEAAWDTIQEYPIEQGEVVPERDPMEIQGIRFEAFPVEHSTRCPAVGYRIAAGRVTIFYVPDVVYIHDREQAMKGTRLFVGDGATVTRNMVRKSDGKLIGHTPLRTQLTWCQKEGVREAIFTHCGSEIVEGDERTLGAEVRSMAQERNVEATIAHDGMEKILR